MATSKPSKRARLEQHLSRRPREPVGEKDWEQLKELLTPISDGYLRRLLRCSGLPLAPLVEGVRQDSFEDLERTLLALEGERTAALRAGNPARAQACRRAVIEAKDHARLVLRSPKTEPAKAAWKQEMLLWILVWLENPGVFGAWLGLRKQARSEGRA
ncbi:MAG: hypothetical protein FJW34_15435 [Acidobacteria bacterium]|nr:hypothetical protein [Acidobacteriota bacterium]